MNALQEIRKRGAAGGEEEMILDAVYETILAIMRVDEVADGAIVAALRKHYKFPRVDYIETPYDVAIRFLLDVVWGEFDTE